MNESRFVVDHLDETASVAAPERRRFAFVASAVGPSPHPSPASPRPLPGLARSGIPSSAHSAALRLRRVSRTHRMGGREEAQQRARRRRPGAGVSTAWEEDRGGRSRARTGLRNPWMPGKCREMRRRNTDVRCSRKAGTGNPLAVTACRAAGGPRLPPGPLDGPERTSNRISVRGRRRAERIHEPLRHYRKREIPIRGASSSNDTVIHDDRRDLDLPEKEP